MRSRTTAKFRALHGKLPAAVRAKARQAFRQWSENPQHPSLRFKKVHGSLPVYSVRVDLDWRAVGVLDEGVMIWFWIGSHADYESLLREL